MPQFRLNRRAVLRGAGGIAIALPWLEIMAPARPARAAGTPARRFVGVFTPGGTVLDNWRPTGTETDFTLSTILQPLAPVQPHVMVVDGIDMTCAVGEQNQAGLVALLTGSKQTGSPNDFAANPSIDQVLASRLSANLRLPSLELAVRWGTGKAHGLPSPIDIMSFANTAAATPIPPRLDPAQIWQDLFGAVTPTGSAAWEKSILDAVDRRYVKLSKRLGAADRQRLEAHLEQLRELEKRAGAVAGCTPPALVDTSDYDPLSGLNSGDAGQIKDVETDAAIPKVGKLMLDMLVMALACDLTSVATLMWSDTEGKHTFPWLGLNETLSCYMNDCGYQPEPLTKIFTWYQTQHAYLIDQLSRHQGGDGRSLLEETVVFFGSNLQNPATHAKTDMPFLLAGGGGGLRAGRWVQNQHAPHNNFLVSLLNLFGDDRTTFGAAEFCTGPLGGLT
jgi:hypothetical protein